MPALGDLAVVIPVGPNDRSWRDLLPLLAGLPANAEVLLCMVDDDAQPGPDDPRVRVLRGAAGRAAQQNRGAAASARPWLWFLHADSRFDHAALSAIERLPDRPALAWFDLRFHDGGMAMALNTVGVWLRSRWLRMPFGDQGLLLPRAAFTALGGFDPSLDGGEDHALVWAARRAGLPLRPLRAALSTSARKYRERGWWRTTARHLRLTWAQARRFSAAPE
jgi:GT2 family glycosyltransferase